MIEIDLDCRCSQEVEPLLCQHEVLSLKPHSTKKNKEKEKNIIRVKPPHIHAKASTEGG
jgi:hypothetical protein